MGKSAEIVAACKREWPTNKTDCNKFAKAVAAHFGVVLSGDADSIVRQMSGPGWTLLADGKAAAAEAKAGKLVLGGLKAADLGSAHGHIVIVVDGVPEQGKYPIGYWGSLNPAIRDNGGLGKGINWSFDKSSRDKVVYAARTV